MVAASADAGILNLGSKVFKEKVENKLLRSTETNGGENDAVGHYPTRFQVIEV